MLTQNKINELELRDFIRLIKYIETMNNIYSFT
jgi:hypothetical protein